MHKKLRKTLHRRKNNFSPKNEIVDALNTSIKTLDADMSSLKYPLDIRSERKLKNKKLKLEKTLITSAVTEITSYI